MSQEKLNLAETELETEVIKDLVELIKELKKTGLLGMIKEFVKDFEAFLANMQNDTSFTRTFMLLGAFLEATRKLDGSQMAGLKLSTENATYCALDSLSKTDASKAKPRGLWGLMSALRDPDVQKGIGYVVEIMKNLGSCMNKKEE
ncbi:MAG: DUF1641 domain-containing protein [Desulfurococcales archaeon]|nr:DUF1641 domain-containing protein [Desulfurococcales archaeon]